MKVSNEQAGGIRLAKRLGLVKAACVLDHGLGEDGDPHGEIIGLADEDVRLCGEEPDERIGREFAALVGDDVSGAAGDDEVELQFAVAMAKSMHGRGSGAHPPHGSVAVIGDGESFDLHDIK